MDAQFDTLRDHSRKYVVEILHACGGRKKEAARVLGISLNTLKRYERESLPTVTMAELMASVNPTKTEPAA